MMVWWNEPSSPILFLQTNIGCFEPYFHNLCEVGVFLYRCLGKQKMYKSMNLYIHVQYTSSMFYESVSGANFRVKNHANTVLA